MIDYLRYYLKLASCFLQKAIVKLFINSLIVFKKKKKKKHCLKSKISHVFFLFFFFLIIFVIIIFFLLIFLIIRVVWSAAKVIQCRILKFLQMMVFFSVCREYHMERESLVQKVRDSKSKWILSAWNSHCSLKSEWNGMSCNLTFVVFVW